MPKLSTREYRTILPMQIQKENKRIDSSFYVEGYAARYEPYLLFEDENGKYFERFERGCFNGCDMNDIIMQYDHSGKVLARMRNKTLIVEPDENGLFICADLSKSESARGMYEEISNGLVDRMSWGFIPGDYHFEKESRTIVHTRIKKIFDVSAVSIPANDNTNIEARSFINGEIDRMAQELREHEIAKEKLNLRLKLEGF